ncbi:transposase, IS605 OrfB family [Methanohalobium evestigatum Z-7303]|uniref:Transposase, IS605 OrfB family n=1 Tax=Methanohalobium evestigatum (strain ATCC BAA-1072 / DSM 3721 / NBRC 107634 / OCM 161 / Z-7303) TaxID=644295 RepID=D7E7T7_METEZ|nr:RNA-guided endonuclease TnpB family protein [Methanohalobium evestigatum]ADI74160.1 transposase, IS605 OrfB family [Methanohalobium evestigatum Z-7303]
MIVSRTETIRLKHENKVSRLCHISKNLYNQANYIIRQNWLNGYGYTKYQKVNEELKGTENYSILPSQTAQQTLKMVDRNWKSFFNSLKDYKINPHKYEGKPKPPNYKKKDGEFLLIFTSQQLTRGTKDNYLKFPKKLGLKIKTRLNEDTNIQQVRIVPLGVGYKCEIVYKQKIEHINLNENNIASIDLGINNIITMVNNIGEKPIVIKGGGVKSINQYYNKKKSQWKSFYDKRGFDETKRLEKLYQKRNNKINDFFHKVSKKIINYCIENNIGTLVIGYNEGWKQECNIGKKNNQNFVQIPFFKLKKQIEYKSEDAGIKVVFQEESYTSKCSFLDDEPIEKRTSYLGKRIKRGLFKSNTGKVINADVNGAYNILKKAFPGIMKGIEGVALHPVSISHECN